MAYAVIADVKEYLGLTDTAHDALLTRLITAAQKYIEQKTGRVFEAAANSTRTLDAWADVEGRRLWLGGDLCAITSVTNGDAVVVSTAQYATEPRNSTPYYAILLLNSSGKAWTYVDDPEKAITIVGKWAYSATPPADIVQATIRLAGWMYRQRDNSADGDRGIIAGNATILPNRVPTDVEALIAPYRPIL